MSFFSQRHVAVLRRDGAGDLGARLGELNRVANALQNPAVLREPLVVEVAQNEFERGCRRTAGHVIDVNETLPAIGGFRVRE
ncbi:MAG: hypothetical protein R2848_19545 [Thermomicrobiales bacterium]